MGLFKSKEQRRIQRDMDIRRGVSQIRKQVNNLRKNESSYLKKARRAQELGDNTQYQFIRNAFKSTYSQRLTLERQLLTIETAVQMKNQTESHAQFAKALNAVSKSISVAFGSTDLTKTQAKFEEAMMKAQSMEERMELFLDMSSESMAMDADSASDLISDTDIDRLLEATDENEMGQIEKEIRQGLTDIEKEMNK